MKLSEFIEILTCKCDRASYLASESLDRDLTFSEKLAWKLHDLVCHNCRKVSQQLAWLHKKMADVPDELRLDNGEQTTQLSEWRKEQILVQLSSSE